METDDQLRIRIPMAAEGFTTAGSKGAYTFFTRSVSPSIVDVLITNPNPGTVTIYPLMAGGVVTPAETLMAVYNACSGETVRPVCDTVVVLPPDRITYALNIGLTLYTGVDQATTQAAVTAALLALAETKRSKIGQDLTKNQVIGAAMVPGVFDVNVNGFTDLTITATQFAHCTGITVNTTATTNG